VPGRISARAALWLGASAVAGAIIMALEMVAFRLYAPYFGYSIYVWSTLVAVVLAALAIGYAIGGRLADRTSSDIPLFAALAASGAYQLVALFSVYAVMPVFARADDFIGTGAATALLFAPPMAALAAVSPLAIRQLAREERIGMAAGSVYAVATVGAIAGTLGASFYLLPELGTRAALQVNCALSLTIGLAGLALRRRGVLGALAILPVLALVPERPAPSGTIWEAESLYNLVRVARRDDRLMLLLNNNAAQTVSAGSGNRTGFYYDQFALGPMLVEAHRGLALGMGAGGSIAAARQTAPEIAFDAVEIDAKVVEAAERWFGVADADPRLRIHVADARRWLDRAPGGYDLVQLDVYQGGPYIPFHLITEEFFRLARSRMNDDALLMMNLVDVGADSELLLAAGATLKRVFPTVLVLSDLRGNHMLFAFTRPHSTDAVRPKLAAIPGSVAESAAGRLAEIDIPAGTPTFTDDWAPVEAMTRRMLRQASD
jgi:predicted membrane-bound spermidine synthase